MKVEFDPGAIFRGLARRWPLWTILALAAGAFFALWGFGAALVAMLPWDRAELLEAGMRAAETLGRTAWGAGVFVLVAVVLIWCPGVSRLVLGNLAFARKVRESLHRGETVDSSHVELAGTIFLSSAIRLAAFLAVSAFAAGRI